MNNDFQFAHAASSTTRPVKRKTRITIYLDDEVLEQFRSLSEQCGKGYQTLINAALRTRLAPPGLDGANSQGQKEVAISS